jgi:carboxylate-amine ligase
MPHIWIVRENKWRAARYGLDADIIVDDQGGTQPLRQSLIELLAELEPVADRLGCAEQLAGTHEVLARGPSYQRQRRVAKNHGGDLHAVVDSLIDEMRTGRPAVVG